MNRELRTLYLNVDRVAVSRDGEAIRIQRPGRAAVLVPFRRVGRAVIRGGTATPGLLDACLALAGAGALVHFAAEGQRPALRLQTVEPPATDSVRELALLVENHPGIGPYRWWMDAQRRHAWSLVFRSGIRGDFAASCARVEHYLRRIGPGHWFPAEIEELAFGLRTWLQAELHRRGWEPVCHALSARGGRLERVLEECLYLPLLWRYASWRRQQPRDLTERERLVFLELQTASRVSEQLHRHLRALAGEYHGSWTRLQWGDGDRGCA